MKSWTLNEFGEDRGDPKRSRDFERVVHLEHDTRRKFIFILDCRFVKLIIPKIG
jgi:hypothetical protein